MKRAYAGSQYAKLYERYCREQFPEEAKEIFDRAEQYYREFMKEMPDLGENMMAKNKLFEKTYVKFQKIQREHREKGEWLDSWQVEINPDHRTEGFSFHLIGCPIAKHAKAHGYEELLPYLCRTDHFLASVMHARLIRTQTEALGGAFCDYWYVGDKSSVLEEYEELEEI